MSSGSILPAKSANERTLEYDSLDASKRQIRLLYVHFDQASGQPPSYELQTFESEHLPEYRALSYAWGEPTPLHSLLVGNMDLPIRQNLRNFLDNYRRPGYIWIDQICINQDNKLERNHQVGMMAGIYSKSQQVIVWLDTDSLEAKEAADNFGGLKQSDDILRENVYFTRLWIVQEILLARDVEVICHGTTQLKHIRWRKFRTTLGRISASFSLTDMERRFAVLLEDSHYNIGDRNLLTLLLYTNSFQCHEPRDRVYALLGIMKEKDRMQVDYTRSVHFVFIDCVKALYKGKSLLPSRYAHCCVLTLLDLARNMGLDIKGKGVTCFMQFLGELFGKSAATGVHDFGVDITISEPSGDETVNAWWYETSAGKVKVPHRDRVQDGVDTT